MSGAVPLLPLYAFNVCADKISPRYFNELNDVNSKFEVDVYSPSLAAGCANGNIPEALKVQKL
jgi:hypothetical protein